MTNHGGKKVVIPGHDAVTGEQIILSGSGGQGILFLTRFFCAAALACGLNVLTSEVHGMARRGGMVISHVKAGRFASPLIRWGKADLVLIMDPANQVQHEGFLRPGGLLLVNTPTSGLPFGIDADGIATALGAPARSNIVLLGYALASGRLFCDVETGLQVLERISALDHHEDNLRIFQAGCVAARNG
jgi:indolepyruvate ferredoxin oxidoreductase beta subunit